MKRYSTWHTLRPPTTVGCLEGYTVHMYACIVLAIGNCWEIIQLNTQLLPRKTKKKGRRTIEAGRWIYTNARSTNVIGACANTSLLLGYTCICIYTGTLELDRNDQINSCAHGLPLSSTYSRKKAMSSVAQGQRGQTMRFRRSMTWPSAPHPRKKLVDKHIIM